MFSLPKLNPLLENIRSISQTDIQNRKDNIDPQKEVHIPRYEIELEFNPETHILKGISNIAAWNQAEIATNQVNIQVFMNAFKEGNEPPVLPQFIDNAFPSGNKHTEMIRRRTDQQAKCRLRTST